MDASFQYTAPVEYQLDNFDAEYTANIDWSDTTLYQLIDEPAYNATSVGAFYSPSNSSYEYDLSDLSDDSVYHNRYFEYESSIDGSQSSSGSGYPSPALSANSPGLGATQLDERVSDLSLVSGNDEGYFLDNLDGASKFDILASQFTASVPEPSNVLLNDLLVTPAIFQENKNQLYVPKIDANIAPSIQLTAPSPLDIQRTSCNNLDCLIPAPQIKFEQPESEDDLLSGRKGSTLFRRVSSPSRLPSRGSSPTHFTGSSNVSGLQRRKSAPPYAEHLHNMNLAPPKPRKLKQTSPFKCEFPGCEKTFTRPYNLKSHMRTHTAERPYPCSFPGCEKTFSRQHDRNRHSKLHLGIKPYVCPNCEKAFARQDALNRHLRVENGPCALALQNQPKFKRVHM